MSNRKGIAALTACAALSCAGLVRADDSTPFQQDSLSLQPVISADAAPAPRRPLMWALDKAGVATTLDKWNLNVFGHVEASSTFYEGVARANPGVPPDNIASSAIAGRVFDTYEVHKQPIDLNQLDLTLQRAVDPSKGKFDVGFTFESMLGSDSRFIHSNGADFYGPGSFEPNPENQFDFTQAYVDLAVPVGNGLLVRVGKFVTHMGYETINPETDPLYSHSYLFGYAIPFTHTGVMAFYKINDKISVMGGFSRGWNQSLKDNNGDALDGLGQVVFTPTDKTTMYFNFTFGPEATGDSHNWWFVGDYTLQQKISDQLSIAVNADYGLYPHGAADSKSAMWFGAAAYASYTLSDMFTLNARAEWYDDNDGFTLVGIPDAVYEFTFGVAIKPMPNSEIGKNLLLRPEIRYDYSDKAFFNGGVDHSQWTAAMDAVFTF